MASLKVLVFSVPGFNCTVLKSSSERESKEPGVANGGHSVHFVQMLRGFLFSLTSGKELNNLKNTVIPARAGGTVLERALTVLMASSTMLFSFLFGCSDP